MDFEEIYQDYFQEIFLYIASLSKNEIIAEEIAQETFFKALKAIDRFDGSKDIRAWLFTIAKNTYFTYYKKNKLQIPSEIFDMEQEKSVNVTDYLVKEEEAFIVHQYLHSMKEPYKEVFFLRVFGELPFEQIGKIFGKSSGWARINFYRARKQILNYMEEINNEKN